MRFFVTFAAAFVALLVVSVQNSKASTSTRDLTIFLIHGLYGSAETFGSMESILESQDFGAQLGHVEVERLRYETKSEQKTSDVFKDQIFTQMADYFAANNLPVDSPYLLIGHSQGGIVSTKFIFECIQKPQRNCNYRLGDKSLYIDPSYHGAAKYKDDYKNMRPSNIVGLITLGSPLWGTSVGSEAESMVDYISSITGESAKVPVAQMRDMVNGSELVYEFRRNILDYGFPNGMKVVNVAGEIHNALTAMRGYKTKYRLKRKALEFIHHQMSEHDFLVEVPRARTDFIYYLEQPDGSEPIEGRLRDKLWEEAKVTTDFRAVPQPHAPNFPMPLEWGLSGIASVDMEANENDKNESLIVIENFLHRHFGGRVPYANTSGYCIDKNGNQNPDCAKVVNFRKLVDEYIGVRALANFAVDIKLTSKQGKPLPKGLSGWNVDVNRPPMRAEHGIWKGITQDEHFKPKFFSSEDTGAANYQGFNQTSEDGNHTMFFHLGQTNLWNKNYPENWDIPFDPSKADTNDPLVLRDADRVYELKTYSNHYLIKNIRGCLPKRFTLQVAPSYTTYAEIILDCPGLE